MWVGHSQPKQGSLVWQVIEEDPTEKRPLGKATLRWEDYIKKNVKMTGTEI